MSEPEAKPTPAEEPETTRVGRFIQTYHGFLSSFVIGAAGLIATTLWQLKQADIARTQGDYQQKLADRKAGHDWKVVKAEILSKNLQVLSAQGPGNIEQKYGVLMSLTREGILDGELAVSYALELGKDNADYMRAILANVADKDYGRLLNAYVLTCDQKYDVSRPVELCKGDARAARSAGLAELVADELQPALANGKPGPLQLLDNEHKVQIQAAKLKWLFKPALDALYNRRQWNELTKFEHHSVGAQLVAALVLAEVRTGELVTQAEASSLDKFHRAHREWLKDYLLKPSCDAECKANLVEVMLTGYEESQGDYAKPMRSLIELPPAESSLANAKLHTRLLWCRVDPKDVEQLRDNVLVPALADALKTPKPEPGTIEAIAGLVAVVPAPKDPSALGKWKEALAGLQKSGGHHYRDYLERRAAVDRDRANPPAAKKKESFCTVAPAAVSVE